jgi:broad specificity phosphatase PhoE
MLEILIVRHGETAWNTGNIFRGRASVPLSELGLKQAEQVGEYLSNKNINAVYCSPLERAVQTALSIAKPQSLTPQTMEDLNDQDFGEWEGVAVEEVKKKYGEVYKQWTLKPDLVKIPGGELLADVRKRCIKALDRIIEKHKEGSIVIVTHRMITKVLICIMLGLDNSHIWAIDHDTCGVTTFFFNPTYNIYILKRHNDISFLK